ncbi:MAG: DNA repair protein RadC [Chitinophagales bacterium]
MEKSYPESSGIKSWAEEDRPREKLMQKGKQSLSESELIAILVRTGTEKNDALQVSKELLNKVKNDLNELSKLSVKDMLGLSVKGIGETKAITIVAALELGRRRQSSEVKEKEKFTSSRDIFETIYPMLADKQHEEFWILLLNRANKLIEKIQISTGGLTGTVADVRMIFEHAIKSKATSVILSHNHPSGNLSPSQTDIDLTKKMVKGGETLDIKVLDHIIIGDNQYYSFADEGMI